MGQPLRNIYPHATKFQVIKWKVSQFLKKLLRIITKLGLTAGILYATFLSGSYFNPQTVTAYQDKLIESTDFPIMDKIAKCESITGQLAKNGQVQVHANNNGTVDAGAYQINVQTWGAKATELGYNIFTAEGNKAMAMWIYKNKGTGPWSSSSNCWNK